MSYIVVFVARCSFECLCYILGLWHRPWDWAASELFTTCKKSTNWTQ